MRRRRWEVAEIVGICKQHGYARSGLSCTNANMEARTLRGRYVQPAVYQGIYNFVHRDVEPELIHVLRKFGIAFYEFNARESSSFMINL